MRAVVRPTPVRVLLLVVVALAGAVAVLFAWAFAHAPAGRHLDAHVAAIARAERAIPVPLSRIAPVAREAVVATEDERFARERGVDLLGLLRAAPYDAVHLTLAQGASTITEQLGKNVYLGGTDRSPLRKAEEIALGFRLGRHYGRSTILDDYLNISYFGDGQWGIENASRHYFGRSAARLTLAQASLLGGLVQAPSSYDPRLHPAAARARQIEVLAAMVRNGDLSPAQATAVAAAPLRVAGAAPLPADPGVTFARGASFDPAGLGLGGALLAGAVALLVLARLRPGLGVPALARLAAVGLLVAALFVAVRSVAVV
jgi:penicillin-binding protein 1A